MSLNLFEAQLQPSIQLPQPTENQSVSIFAAFERRKTIREILETPLPLQLVSNLLWCAYGVNRANGPFGAIGRTAASASNSQEIDLYVAVKEGVYLYNAITHTLIPITTIDVRAEATTPGQRNIDVKAPVQLIFVVDIHRLTHTEGFKEPGLHDPDIQKSYYFVDTGIVAGNVYLFAAAHGLAAWFHNCDKIGLKKDLGLRAEQHALFAQSIGYPKTE